MVPGCRWESIIFINDPSGPPSAPIGNQRRLDPMLPGGPAPDRQILDRMRIRSTHSPHAEQQNVLTDPKCELE